MTTSKPHSLCSPSTAYRWLACPGSVGECYNLPPQPTSKYAEEGIRAHSLAEFLLKNWDEDSGKAVSDVIVEDPDPEITKYVYQYVEFVKYIYRSFDSKPSIRLETNLVLDEDMKLFGTADVAMTGLIGGKATGVVIDLKYGKTKVIANENPQLAYYATALRRTSKKPIELVKTIVYQPRVNNGVTEVVYTAEELDAWEQKIKLGAEKSLLQIVMPKARELNMGDHCKWCPAISTCPAKSPPPEEGAGLEFFD